MTTDEIMSLCDQVRETAYAIHVYHGNGYLEKVYENALVNRLRKEGVSVKQQYPIRIKDEDGVVIGEYVADVMVNDCLLVELKACKAITNEHKAQVLHYLKATGISHGLLINFGSYRFEIKKFIETQSPRNVPGNT
ncbi:MAG: GxxExxY protein [bacterium]|nr:GxxExxY protein [bacterium]